MKRKDYKEVSPEPKDYEDSDYSDDLRPSSWAAAERDDNDCIFGKRCPRRRVPKAPTVAATTTTATTMKIATTTAETLEMMTLSECI
jgi:hypothetical protein